MILVLLLIWQKKLEFRAVAVMTHDDETVPLQKCIETVGDDADLQEFHDTERICRKSPARLPGSSAVDQRRE
jgi:hypothetical protein